MDKPAGHFAKLSQTNTVWSRLYMEWKQAELMETVREGGHGGRAVDQTDNVRL